MPELPEVETIVRDLAPHLRGRRIVGVQVGRKRLRRPWRAEWEGLLIGKRIDDVLRRGKWIALRLDGELHLVIHLGMTGQLVLTPAADSPAAHTHLIVALDAGDADLRFRDIRRFGSITLMTADEWREQVGSELGPEPFTVDKRYWRESLAATRRCVKAVLLDQRIIAGVGNIYADESLFEARLHPGRLACDLHDGEALRLRTAIAKVLKRAITRRGSTIQNYVGGSGLMGKYQNEFRAYGRTGEPCRRCKTPIECIRLAGRSTHYCPRCQPRIAPALCVASRLNNVAK